MSSKSIGIVGASIGIAALLAGLGVLPAASLNVRTFLGAPAQEATLSDSAGIFNPGDPSNSCFAFSGIGGRTPEADNAYYGTARLVTNRGRSEQPASPGSASVDGAGTPIDDCFGLTTPGNDVVVPTGAQAEFGSFFGMDAITAATLVTEVPSVLWTVTRCPIASASDPATTATGAPNEFQANGETVDCTGTSYNFTTLVTVFGAGFFSTGFEEVAVRSVVPPGAGDSVVESCVEANLLDIVIGVSVFVTDEDYFVVDDVADGSALAQEWNFATSGSAELTNWADLTEDEADPCPGGEGPPLRRNCVLGSDEYSGASTVVSRNGGETQADEGNIVCNEGSVTEGGMFIPFGGGDSVSVVDDLLGTDVAFQVCVDNDGDGDCHAGPSDNPCPDVIFFSHADGGPFYNPIGPLPTGFSSGPGCATRHPFDGYVVFICEGEHTDSGGSHPHDVTHGTGALTTGGSGAGLGNFCGAPEPPVGHQGPGVKRYFV